MTSIVFLVGRLCGVSYWAVLSRLSIRLLDVSSERGLSRGSEELTVS
jgi:hypothetical protein